METLGTGSSDQRSDWSELADGSISFVGAFLMNAPFYAMLDGDQMRIFFYIFVTATIRFLQNAKKQMCALVLVCLRPWDFFYLSALSMSGIRRPQGHEQQQLPLLYSPTMMMVMVFVGAACFKIGIGCLHTSHQVSPLLSWKAVSDLNNGQKRERN